MKLFAFYELDSIFVGDNSWMLLWVVVDDDVVDKIVLNATKTVQGLKSQNLFQSSCFGC